MRNDLAFANAADPVSSSSYAKLNSKCALKEGFLPAKVAHRHSFIHIRALRGEKRREERRIRPSGPEGPAFFALNWQQPPNLSFQPRGN